MWESADKVQKNAAGEYRAMIGGEWVPVAKAQKNAQGQYRIERDAGQSAQPEQVGESEPSLIDRGLAFGREAGNSIGRGAINTGKNILSGAADLGATLMTPFDAAGLSGYTPQQRRQSIDEFAGDSAVGQTTRVLTNIAGTAGAGNVLAKGVQKVAPLVPEAAAALRSGGFTTGIPSAKALSVQGAKNAAIRLGGGVGSGAAMAGLINPEDAGMGAAIGGAIPIVGKLGGESGRLLREYAINPLFKPNKAAIEKLIKDAGGVDQARAAIERAKAAGKTLSGESYTLGQASKNAGLASTERARSAVNPESYQPIYQAQRDARIAAMQKITGGADDVTRKDALDNLVNDRSESVADLYATMQNKPFMLGQEGEKLMTRSRPYGALTHAEKLSITQGRKFSIPVVEDVASRPQTLSDIGNLNAARQTYPDLVGSIPDMPVTQPKDLLGEIRKLGGVSMKDAKDLLGERQITKMGVQGGVFTTKGEEVGDMVRRLVDEGVMPPQVLDDVDGGAQALRDAIQNAARGSDDMAMRASAEAYYGAPDALPGAFKEGVSARPPAMPQEVVDRAVKGGDLQSVKEGIDQVISKAEGPQLRAMMQLKTDYLKFMESKSPEYIKANNIFADKSKPITQMSVAQRMLDALTGEAAKHGGEAPLATTKFLQAYRNAPLAARSVSGMKQPVEKIFTPKNLAIVKQVAREVAKHGDLEKLGKGVGSDTVQKNARANTLSSLADIVNSSKTGRAAVNLASLGIKGRVNNRIDALLQSPEFAGKEFDELTKIQKHRLSDLLANPAVRALPIAAQSR